MALFVFDNGTGSATVTASGGSTADDNLTGSASIVDAGTADNGVGSATLAATTAATIRVGAVRAVTAGPGGVATGRSTVTVGAGASIRIGGISATTVASTGATIRIAGITATTVTTVGSPKVRVADISALTVRAQYGWDGTQWVLLPTNIGSNTARGRSNVTGRLQTGDTVNGTGKGRSTVTGSISFTAAAAINPLLSVTDTGTSNQAPGSASRSTSLTLATTVTVSGTSTQGPPGQGSLTVTPDPTNSPPRILLELVGASGNTVTIYRVDQAGGKVPVRTANPGLLSSGALLLWDYEAPYGQQVQYQALATRTITSDWTVLDVEEPWLLHPGIPDRSVPLSIVTMGDETFTTNMAVHQPLGRRDSLVRTDGVRRAATFDLQVATVTTADRDSLTTILSDSLPLLLQVRYPNIDESDYRWVSVGDVTFTRVVDFYGEPRRAATLPCTVTTSPSGLLQAQRTWADILSEFATWQDLIDTYDTWADVLTDTRKP